GIGCFPMQVHLDGRPEASEGLQGRDCLVTSGMVIALVMRLTGMPAPRHACSTRAGDSAANRQNVTSSWGMNKVRRTGTALPAADSCAADWPIGATVCSSRAPGMAGWYHSAR